MYSSDSGVFQHFTDDFHRFFLDLLAMFRPEEAFTVDFIGIFSAGRTRREPAVLGHHLQPADRSTVARRFRQTRGNGIASQGAGADHIR